MTGENDILAKQMIFLFYCRHIFAMVNILAYSASPGVEEEIKIEKKGRNNVISIVSHRKTGRKYKKGMGKI